MAKPSCFSTKIDPALAEKLKTDLLNQGFELGAPPYTLFSAKKKGVSCTLYESGKLTVQGKDMETFIEFYLEPEILQKFDFSHPLANLDFSPRIGMDEAGKGDFFGPLCIAALYADKAGIEHLCEMGVKDSKRFSDDSILKMAKKIRPAFAYTVIRLFPSKYNELYGKFKNLNRLLSWAHTAALSDLSAKTGCKEAILDQFAFPELMEKMLKQKKLDVNLIQRTKGENDLVVAGASILARAAFLEGMEKLSEEFSLTLPKGAAAQVKVAAKKLVEQFGRDVLDKVAKTHFKTTAEIDATLP